MTTTKNFFEYMNGNVKVSIDQNTGEKKRYCDGVPQPTHPESIDLKITDYCDAGCAYCFPENSKISTKDGEKSIQDIKIGDIVYSFDTENNKIEMTSVSQIYTRDYDGELIVIELEHGTVKVTPDHEIFVKNKGWVLAKNILEGDDILDIYRYER